MITQRRNLGNDWSLEIRYGTRRRIYKLAYRNQALPMNFYSEQAAFTWLTDMKVQLT